MRRVRIDNAPVFATAILLISAAAPAQEPRDSTIFPADTQRAMQAGGAQLLEAVCQGKVATGKEIACRTGCPGYTSFGNPKEPGMTWSLAAVTRGYFVSPTTEDAALWMEGCEPHTENFGGTILLTRKSQVWSMVWYKPGVETSRCHKVRLHDRREILVCLGVTGAQGQHSTELYTEDLLHPAATLMAEAPSFFSAFDNTSTCGENEEDERKPYPVVHTRIERVEFPATSDSPVIAVTAAFGTRAMTPALVEACSKKPGGVLPPTTTYRLEFSFDGRDFKPAPRSVDAARLFEAR